MILPYDPLREAILQELSWAISIRRAQGVSLDALEREYGLSKETLYLIVERTIEPGAAATDVLPIHD